MDNRSNLLIIIDSKKILALLIVIIAANVTYLNLELKIQVMPKNIPNPNKITIGEDVYNVLHPEIKSKFVEVKSTAKNWKYTDRERDR
jgi:hypothetical protein